MLRRLRDGLDRYFGVTAAGTTPAGEARAGLTTFLAMAYILVVNPAILGGAIRMPGVNLGPELLTATALAAAVGTTVMALWARYPFAVAPGMGLNAYFAITVVGARGIPWETALGAVFISGVCFLLLSLVGVRELIVRAIPKPLRVATAAGIGLFLAHLGAQHGGLVVKHPVTLVTLGDPSSAAFLLSVLGILVTGVLLARRWRGAILIGVVVTTALAIGFSAKVYGGKAFAGFSDGVLRAPVWPTHLAGQLDIVGALQLGLLDVLFVFLFVDFFDTAGTLLGLSQRSGLADAEGNLPRSREAFGADAVATGVGALLGTSTTTSYIESQAGIADGGRTGLTALVVALLFLLSLFAWPLFAAIPLVATAPCLIIVGAAMLGALADVDWGDPRVVIPVFLTVITMPLTYSIANGITLGIISYAVIHAASGRARQVHWIMYVLAALLVARFIWLRG